MLKRCEHCSREFETPYPSKQYCNKECSKKAYYKRDESFYEFPHLPDAELLFSFQCKNCGREVKIYSRYDQRNSFCCGICAQKYHAIQRRKRLAKQKYTSNLGMSGGMSLGRLIRREARSVDREKVILVKICPACGKKFDTTRQNAKYCSSQCRYQAYYSGHRKFVPKNLTCPTCGKSFSPEPLQRHMTYCSKECYRARQLITKVQRRQSQKELTKNV